MKLKIANQEFHWEDKPHLLWRGCNPQGLESIAGLTGDAAVYTLRFFREYMEDHFSHLVAQDKGASNDAFFEAWEFLNRMLKASLLHSSEEWIDLNAEVEEEKTEISERVLDDLLVDINASDLSKESVQIIKQLVQSYKENNEVD